MRGAYRLRQVSEAALIERAEELLATQYERVTALLPGGCRPFDAHTHLGLDEDGHALSLEEHLRIMDEAGVSGANVFALNEPDREPAYRAPNDRVLRWAAEAPDRLFPFVRLSLDEDPLGEAERCLALGARGIKLHPRAQAFRVDDRSLEAVFALADERRLPVLIHAGRGLPPGHAAAAWPRGGAAPQRLADPRARGDRGAGRDRRTGAQRREHLLRQLDLVAARPAQPAFAGAAGAAPVGLGHPLWRAARGAQRVRPRGARSGADDALLLGMLGDNAAACSRDAGRSAAPRRSRGRTR